MPDFRTIATFRSSRFPLPADSLPDENEPLVRWVADELQRTSSYRVHPEEVDWGACLRIESIRTEYQLNVAAGHGSPPYWMLEVQDRPRLVKRLPARRDPLEHARLVEAVHMVLSSDSSITELRWHLDRAFGKGDLSTAAEEPDHVPDG